MLNYEKLLKEEGKTTKDLPKAITMKINFLNADVKKLAANPKDAVLKEKCGRNDVMIADAIQTWLEKDLPPIAPLPPVVPVDDAAKIKADADAKAATEEAARVKAEEDAEAQKVAEADALKAKEEAEEIAKGNAIVELQNTIVTKMNASNSRAILKTDLEALLGRTANDSERVGQLNLCQVYLSYPPHYKNYK